MEEKRCNICKKMLPIGEFSSKSIYNKKKNKTSFFFNSRCNSCAREGTRIWMQNNRDYLRERSRIQQQKQRAKNRYLSFVFSQRFIVRDRLISDGWLRPKNSLIPQ